MRSIFIPTTETQVVLAEATPAEALAGTDGKFADAATALALSNAALVQQQINSYPQRRIESSGSGIATKTLDIGTQDFVWEWIGGLDDWTPSGNAIIFWSNASSTSPNNFLIYVGTDTKISIQWRDTDITVTTYQITPTTPFVDGTLYRNTLVFDRSTEIIYLYTNGVLNGQVTATGTGSIDIGDGNSFRSNFYVYNVSVGTHCNMEIWVGRAWTAAEVKARALYGTVPDDMVDAGKFNSTDLNNPIQTQSPTGNEILWSDGGTEIVPASAKATKGRLVFRNVDCSSDTYLGGARDVLPDNCTVTNVTIFDESGAASTVIDVQRSDGINHNDLSNAAINVAADGITPYPVTEAQIMDDQRIRVPATTSGGTDLTFIVEYEIINY